MGEAVITFLDGPAEGVKLSLQRLVLFLRVVRSESGSWDALDLLEDQAEPGETIFVYRHNGTEGSAFVDGRDPKTGKRWGRVEHIASYRLHSVQPPDATFARQRDLE